jgi:hypothetical protein
MAMKHTPGERHGGTVVGSGRSYPWMLGGIIVGSAAGLLAGMAQANTVTRDLLVLLLSAIAGALLFGAIFGALGWFIDQSRNRSRAP